VGNEKKICFSEVKAVVKIENLISLKNKNVSGNRNTKGLLPLFQPGKSQSYSWKRLWATQWSIEKKM